jgi:hypothetical protein
VTTFPFDDLEVLVLNRLGVRCRPNGIDGATVNDIAAELGVTQRSVFRYRRSGLTHNAADKLAIAAGYHPANVWPEWLEAS